MARDAVTVIPVQAAEISRVLAKRLFVHIDQRAARATADAYMDMYRRSAAMLPDRACREDFHEAMVAHYPFHPTFIEFLTHKLVTVETFHGTRGVLRVLALALRSLWQHEQSIPMIHTCHLDLREARTMNEIIGRTGSGDLLPVLNTDVGGPDTTALDTGRSRAELADRKNPHPAGFPLHEYTWKTVFLHSLVGRAAGLGSNLFGITEREALFEVACPGVTPPQVETALQAIESSDDAFYLRLQQGRYYASLDPSEIRALASIQGSLHGEQVENLLAATARKAVRAEDSTFDVIPDVSAAARGGIESAERHVETPNYLPAQYTLTAHATVVLAERAIPVAWVTHVLEHPERTEPDRTDSALIHALGRIREFGNRVLRVIYNDTTTPKRIVTVYFDRTQRGIS